MKMGIEGPNVFKTIVTVLGDGGTVIMPCDTIYGIVGIAPETRDKIRNLKGREDKSLLQLIPRTDWLPRFTSHGLPYKLAAYWPGALTIIFPAEMGERKSVALRVPNDPLLKRIMEKLSKSLYSTSVNASGKPALWRIEEIQSAFTGHVDLIVDAGDRPNRSPSTILDITVQPFRILRQGAIELPAEALDP